MRDLTKVQELAIPKLIDYIIEEFHNPAREMLQNIRDLGLKVKQTCFADKNLGLLLEIFNQFEMEFLNHIDKEENDFFPEIINLENGTLKDYSKIKTFLRIQEVEHNEIDNYLIGGKNIVKDLCLVDNEYYDELKKIVEQLYIDSLDHIYIENNYLNQKVENLID